MLANLPIMLFPYAHKFYAFISAHYAHIMLEYSNRIITGEENNFSNYLTFNIIIATSRKGMVLDLDSWVGMDSGDETSEYATVCTAVAL